MISKGKTNLIRADSLGKKLKRMNKGNLSGHLMRNLNFQCSPKNNHLTLSRITLI